LNRQFDRRVVFSDLQRWEETGLAQIHHGVAKCRDAPAMNLPMGRARNVIALAKLLNSTNLNVSGLAIW
jgi:hypothetical protein